MEILRQSLKDKEAFDVIFLDMHMPGMDGLTVADNIRREMGDDLRPVVIMFSSIEKEHVLELGKKAGIDQYLSKPVKMSELYDLIQSHRGRQRRDTRAAEIPRTELKIQPGKTVLVAEDNQINMKLLNVMLASTGIKVLTAVNGREATELFGTNEVDLIFMDIHMPEMDGFQATKIIRTMDRGKEVPIVALTANALAGDREKCLENGMDDYLSKPFVKEDLYKTLVRYLG